ncbi:class I adenylate-forming enzyme family protein [Pusillimonas sp. ANT_WB101]|uniref:class I adenylate-forming enzyme family protein n=1 Tax=Pusillimonas sp. ANT_WB101 TaxID=2597356 RepID=UPI0011EE399F|nr:AMP-binding protein [Pusillimonas sp. ANT_WB101]KAA0911584.1 long-chain fatty acid--CoA ligase [Pusillimonas sp. ANT_WB101]
MLPIDFLQRAIRLYPDNIAIEIVTSKITYRELGEAVNALACALQKADPDPGTRVAMCAANAPAYIVGMLAILTAGKVWVPLNYRSTAPELERILDVTKPSTVLVDQEGDALLSTYKGQKIGFAQFDEITNQYRGQIPAVTARERDDTQAIKFTGGTTGLPKGVMQPCRAWMAGIVNQIGGWDITKDDKFVVCAPISHGTGTYILPILAQGATLLLCTSSDADDILYAFGNQGGTMTFMPPTLIYKLMAISGVNRTNFPKLRLLIYGGAPMPVEKITMALDFFGPVIATTYGQTEAPQIATLLRPHELANTANQASAGRATWYSDIAIVAPDGSVLPTGETGEITIQGELVMTGYWKLPEKTAETIKNNRLHTGDVGYLDERGFLFIKDRLRDVIITGGFNVYPIDVEGALSTHPAVHEASVFGIPDDKWGEAVNAAVQLKPGHSITEDELKAFVKDRLGPVHTPKKIHFYESLPRSAVGKVLKTAVKEQALNIASRSANPLNN